MALVRLGSARSSLLCVVAEFALDASVELPTATLISAMGELGVAGPAVARRAAAGWLEGVRAGRSSRGRLTPAG